MVCFLHWRNLFVANNLMQLRVGRVPNLGAISPYAPALAASKRDAVREIIAWESDARFGARGLLGEATAAAAAGDAALEATRRLHAGVQEDAANDAADWLTDTAARLACRAQSLTEATGKSESALAHTRPFVPAHCSAGSAGAGASASTLPSQPESADKRTSREVPQSSARACKTPPAHAQAPLLLERRPARPHQVRHQP